MSAKLYETVNGQDVTDKMLDEAAQLFSENYGVWSKEAAQTLGNFAKAVVHKAYRERGLATGLLNDLRRKDDDIYGIMSSHPATCLTAAKIFGRGTSNIRLDYISNHAPAVMKASPIPYVRNAKLRGSCFDANDPSDLVSCVDTNFPVDHGEPLEALGRICETMEWPLGALYEGHEFLVLVEARRRRSKSRPLSLTTEGL